MLRKYVKLILGYWNKHACTISINTTSENPNKTNKTEVINDFDSLA
jgi:hypothetical protein